MDGTWWLARPRSAPTGITLAAGTAAVVATALPAAAVIAPSESMARLAAMAVCVASVGAVGGDLVAAMATAGIAWAVLNGFLVNRLGELTWHGRADAVRLSVLCAAALAGWLSVMSYRVARNRRDVVRMRVWLYGGGFASSVGAYKEASPSG
ncbi:hypothetical protein ACPPVO_20935 [Dactylosporangium sp. McL0621]|uniref:hypothetical protein n=1 Tax=Dactylosporangium sp. McL0621 TaxID=3415678 RepID=UPI003CEFAE9F